MYSGHTIAGVIIRTKTIARIAVTGVAAFYIQTHLRTSTIISGTLINICEQWWIYDHRLRLPVE